MALSKIDYDDYDDQYHKRDRKTDHGISPIGWRLVWIDGLHRFLNTARAIIDIRARSAVDGSGTAGGLLGQVGGDCGWVGLCIIPIQSQA